MMKRLASAATLAFSTLLAFPSEAVVPDFVPLQGILADGVGNPVDGTVTLTVRLYDTENAPAGFWSEAQPVAVDDGFFTVYLGATAPLPDNFASYAKVWVGITVDNDAEMERFQLGAVPYALEARVCQQVGSLTEASINSKFAPASHTHNDGVPPGAVMFFLLSDCPAGWSPLAGAQGRVLLGVAPGEPSTSVGTPLPSGGLRTVSEVPAHTHSVDPPSQAVTVANESSHTHSVNPAAFTIGGGDHTHGASSASGGAHSHTMTLSAMDSASAGDALQRDPTQSTLTGSTSSAGAHSHTITISSSAHTHTVDVPSTTTSGPTAHTHGASFDMPAFSTTSAGVGAVDVTMPYLQLLVCIKN